MRRHVGALRASRGCIDDERIASYFWLAEQHQLLQKSARIKSTPVHEPETSYHHRRYWFPELPSRRRAETGPTITTLPAAALHICEPQQSMLIIPLATHETTGQASSGTARHPLAAQTAKQMLLHTAWVGSPLVSAWKQVTTRISTIHQLCSSTVMGVAYASL
jgi:hypothetical protein